MPNSVAIEFTKSLDRNKLIALNLFWLGFIIYIVSYTISATEQVNFVVCNVFQIIGIALFIPSAVYVSSLRFENSYLKVLLLLYICWSLGVILRGIEFDYFSIKQMLFSTNFGVFLYFVPLILLFPRDLVFYKKVFDVIIVLSIFFLLYSLLFIKELVYPYANTTSQAIIEYFSQQLSLPAGFLLLTSIYHTRKKNIFAIIILGLTFILSVIRARRGLMFMSLTMLMFSYLIFQIANKAKILSLVMSFFLITILAYSAVRVYEKNRTDTFGYITERFGQKTRSGVEQYFYRDLKTQDWIVGKGYNGMYYCPGVEEGVGKITIYRKVIETGYLQVILNGGLISLGLFLLMAIPAVIKGIFFSENFLSKASGVWIFLFLTYMYPGTFTIFSMHYILVWIAIGICFSPDLRNLPDSTIKELFSSPKPLNQ